jgi:hypothetical protein
MFVSIVTIVLTLTLFIKFLFEAANVHGSVLLIQQTNSQC